MIKVKKIADCYFDNELYLSFWNKCFVHSKNINDVSFHDISSFASFYEVGKFFGDFPYLVMEDNRMIGFFFDDRDHNSNAIGLSIYLSGVKSPRKEYLNMNVILLCGALHNWFMVKKYSIDFLELNTFSKKIVENVLFFSSNLNVYEVRPEYYIIHNSIINMDLSFVEELFHSFLVKQDEERSYTFNVPMYIEKDNKRLPLLEKK